MKMMKTDDARKLMKQDEAAQALPPRYQPWKTPFKGGGVDVKAEYQEQWDGVFLTASREVRNCRIVLAPAAPGSPTLSVKDRENLESGLKGVNLEVDTQTGKSWLLPVVGSFAAGELQCHNNDGGRISNERENKTMVFDPPIYREPTGGWVAGSAASGATIACGELNLDTKPDAHSLTGMMSVTAPLKVKIRWELTPQ